MTLSAMALRPPPIDPGVRGPGSGPTGEHITSWLSRMRHRRDLHPIMFGVYGDLVYHHCAGFREPLTRLDSADIRRRVAEIDPPDAERDDVRERLRQERAAAN